MSWHRLLWQLYESPKGAGRKPAEAAAGVCGSGARGAQSHRGVHRGLGTRPASCALRASGRVRKRSGETGASERALGLGEPAPSVGFKRPLSAPRVAELVLGAAWPELGSKQLPVPTLLVSSFPVSQNGSRCLEMGDRGLEANLEET